MVRFYTIMLLLMFQCVAAERPITDIVKTVEIATAPYYIIHEHTNISIPCRGLQLMSEQNRLKWMQVSNSWLAQEQNVKMQDEGILEIVDVRAANAGWYVCSGNNALVRQQWNVGIEVQIPIAVAYLSVLPKAHYQAGEGEATALLETHQLMTRVLQRMSGVLSMKEVSNPDTVRLTAETIWLTERMRDMPLKILAEEDAIIFGLRLTLCFMLGGLTIGVTTLVILNKPVTAGGIAMVLAFYVLIRGSTVDAGIVLTCTRVCPYGDSIPKMGNGRTEHCLSLPEE